MIAPESAKGGHRNQKWKSEKLREQVQTSNKGGGVVARSTTPFCPMIDLGVFRSDAECAENRIHFSRPSGPGKPRYSSTYRSFKGRISVRTPTGKARNGEQNGVDYFFTDRPPSEHG